MVFQAIHPSRNTNMGIRVLFQIVGIYLVRYTDLQILLCVTIQLETKYASELYAYIKLYKFIQK